MIEMPTVSEHQLNTHYPALRISASREFVLLALLFGSVGGIAWAIRGTSGWGGIDGTIVPGMAWGLLWYWVCRLRGIEARGVALWLGLGIAIGGELGYGQYVSWIRGMFYVGEEVVNISPWIGYLWFVLVGIGWGAPGGVALGWVLSSKSSLHSWFVRLLVPLGVALLGRMLIQVQPGWFFPNYSPELYATLPGTQFAPVHFLQTQNFMIVAWCVGITIIVVSWILKRNTHLLRGFSPGMSILSVAYTACLFFWMGLWLFFPHDGVGLFDGELGKHLGRTVYTNSQNAIVVAWWVGALVVAALQRDRPTLVMGMLIGGGFGLGMMLSALWCLGYGFAPHYIDWWKMWEVNAGFNLGVLYVIALFWILRQTEKGHSPELDPTHISVASTKATYLEAWGRPLASAVGVLLVWVYLFYEDGLYVSVLLGPLYVVAVLWISWQESRDGGPEAIHDRQQRLSLLFCWFYLLFILIYGATYRLGVVLELYEEKTIGQYEWLAERLWLFIPAAIVIVAVTLFKVWQFGRQRTIPDATLDRVTLAIGDLIMLIGVVGALTIWPSKIAVVYASFLFIAMFAFIRLNRHYQKVIRG
jgi:hypothetical protein